MPRSVLLMLSQFPFDPASGAARSMMSAAVVLAGAGFKVRALATTASEALPVAGPRGVGAQAASAPALPLLAQLGLRAEVDRRAAVGRGCPILRFSHRGVAVTLLDTGPLPLSQWEFQHGQQFNRLLMQELEKHAPEIVLTFGGTPPEQARRQACRAAGAAVVFGLRNLSYLHPLAFEAVDAVLTPSEFLSRVYRERIGLTSTAIPPILEPEDCVCPSIDPKWFTFVNPTPAKGVYFFVALADELARNRPEIGLQVIEGRGRREHLYQAGFNVGLDLRKHPTLRVVPARPRPRDVYADSRAMLIPSLCDEGFGRVAAEAMLNGVPALVTDRGGLGEAAGHGGLVFNVPAHVHEAMNEPVPRSVVRPWMEEIIRLTDDAEHFSAARERARTAGALYRLEKLTPRYVEYFSAVGPAARPVVVAGAAAPAARQAGG